MFKIGQIFILMDIIEFPFYSVFYIDEISINLLLQSDIEDLPTLYRTSKRLFDHHLENLYILKKLGIKYDLQEYSITNFKHFLYVYKNKIEAPYFGLGNRCDHLPLSSIWTKEKKDRWLNKVRRIENSNLVSVFINGTIMTGSGYSMLRKLVRDAISKELLWETTQFYYIERNCLTPTAKVYHTVNNYYWKLIKK